MSHVLAHAVNVGYENYNVQRLLRINGIKIKNMIQLMNILDYIIFIKYIKNFIFMKIIIKKKLFIL